MVKMLNFEDCFIIHNGRWIGNSKLPLDMNGCLNECVHGVLRYTGLPLEGVPEIASSVTLNRMMQLHKAAGSPSPMSNTLFLF